MAIQKTTTVNYPLGEEFSLLNPFGSSQVLTGNVEATYLDQNGITQIAQLSPGIDKHYLTLPKNNV